MADSSTDSGGASSLAAKIVLAGVAIFVVATLISWVVGAVVAIVRTLAIVAVVLGLGWALLVAMRR
jgi:hypothetical protein